MISILAAEYIEEEQPAAEEQSHSRWKDRTPVDVVAPQHVTVHGLLLRWGVWNRGFRGSGCLGSAESLYEKFSSPPSTAPMSSDPQIMDVERAVIRMPQFHAWTLRMFYVRRLMPVTIVRSSRPRMRYEAWVEHIFVCRAMCLNLLRRRYR